jgi:hypothetical protein
MKKKFENIDDLFLFKINNLDDADVEINEHLIWKDIENQLDSKKNLRVLWWKYTSAASVVLLLGLGYFGYQREGNPKINVVANAPVHREKDSFKNIISNDLIIKNKIQNTDNQLVKNTKVKILNKNANSKRTSIDSNSETKSKDLSVLKPLHSMDIQKAEITFNPVDIKSIEEVNLPKKLRVMHMEDFKMQPIDRINQPKTFYVFFNKEFNIDNQLPSVVISHPNNIN